MTGGAGSYTYPNVSDDEDRKDVLRNKFDIRTHSELRIEEYRATEARIMQIAEGDGPKGSFDKEHLKAIHGFIFQDVYEWAGHTRNERPVVDGMEVEPVGNFRKGDTSFLHGSRIDQGLSVALRPIRDPEVLRNSTSDEFIDRASKVMAELNYVHGFREGNGRAQETFIRELGREYGHEVEFSVITKPRMIEASIATTNDPDHPSMKHVLRDAIEPGRREAIRATFEDIRKLDEEPLHYNIRTARPGEEITGQVAFHDQRTATVVSSHDVIAVDRADLPERIPTGDVDITFRANSDYSRLADRAQQQQADQQPRQAEAPAQAQPVTRSVQQVEAQMAKDRQVSRDDYER